MSELTKIVGMLQPKLGNNVGYVGDLTGIQRLALYANVNIPIAHYSSTHVNRLFRILLRLEY